jgi:hypothetical protein
MCLHPGQTIPGTFTLTYSNLPFGAPITPTLRIAAFGNIQPIFWGEVGTPTDTIINGSLNIDFGSTVTLTSLLVTDANGHPIPSVTISSQDGVDYPLDPSNVVPEPASFALLSTVVAGLIAFKYRKRLKLG